MTKSLRQDRKWWGEGNVERQKRVKEVKYTVTEGDLTLGGEHTMQYTDDGSSNYILEPYIILLTNITPVNLIKILKSTHCQSFVMKN